MLLATRCTWLHLAQTGLKHPQAKALKGFGSAGVLEVVEDDDGNTGNCQASCRLNACVHAAILPPKSPPAFSSFSVIL
jgi:hypothetical protein